MPPRGPGLKDPAQFNVWCERQLRDEFVAAARSQHLSASQVVSAYMRRYVREHDEQPVAA